MKIVIALLLLCAALLPAQGTHTATLNWTDTLNPTGTTYNVYRASGLCSGTPAFSKVASSVTGTTFLDITLTVGSWCYQVTAISNGVEGPPSPQASATVGPFAPSQLTITVK